MANQGKISIMCRVAAVFRNNEGGKYVTTPLKLDTNAPAWIQQSKFFDLLVKDGSMVLATTPAVKRGLENDPTKGTGPDGKTVVTKQKKAKEKEQAAESDQKPGDEEKSSAPDEADGEDDGEDDAE